MGSCSWRALDQMSRSVHVRERTYTNTHVTLHSGNATRLFLSLEKSFFTVKTEQVRPAHWMLQPPQALAHQNTVFPLAVHTKRLPPWPPTPRLLWQPSAHPRPCAPPPPTSLRLSTAHSQAPKASLSSICPRANSGPSPTRPRPVEGETSHRHRFCLRPVCLCF